MKLELEQDDDAVRSSELQAIEAVEAFCGRKMPVPVPPDMRAVVVSHAEHIRDAGGHTPLTILARIMLQPWIAPTPLRDFIARAISDDSVARWNDTKAAGRVLTMPEMQAVRKALYQLASATEYQMRPEQLLGEGAIGLAPLPASVVAWVLEGEQ